MQGENQSSGNLVCGSWGKRRWAEKAVDLEKRECGRKVERGARRRVRRGEGKRGGEGRGRDRGREGNEQGKKPSGAARRGEGSKSPKSGSEGRIAWKGLSPKVGRREREGGGGCRVLGRD